MKGDSGEEMEEEWEEGGADWVVEEGEGQVRGHKNKRGCGGSNR